MELPEEAGQALGSLLGDAVPPAARRAARRSAHGHPRPRRRAARAGLYADDDGGSTRVAAADEFDQLLADTASIADRGAPRRSQRPSRRRGAEGRRRAGSFPRLTSPVTPASAAGVDARRARRRGRGLLADADDVEKVLPPAPPPSGTFKAPTLPEPGLKLPSGRFKTESGRYQTQSGRFQTESGRYQTPSGKFPAPTPAPKTTTPKTPVSSTPWRRRSRPRRRRRAIPISRSRWSSAPPSSRR